MRKQIDDMSASSAEMQAQLRSYGPQVRGYDGSYRPPGVEVPRGDMAFWLGAVARGLREDAQRKAIHIASKADKTEATISRFETNKTKTFPDADGLLPAYARDLEIDELAIWEAALSAYRGSRQIPSVRPQDVEHLIEEAVQKARQPPDNS